MRVSFCHGSEKIDCYDLLQPSGYSCSERYQQDAARMRWVGLVAGIDGSVNDRTQCMGAGYAVGDHVIPLMILSSRVASSDVIYPLLLTHRILICYASWYASGTHLVHACYA
jgi:hypothetical protein